MVTLKEDVEILVADSTFLGSEIGNQLEKICKKFDIKLFWRDGFALDLLKVPENFRGNKMPSLAKRITEKNYFCTKLNRLQHVLDFRISILFK